MKTNKSAIYAGSFDPLTLGHYWVIEQAAKLFDELIVAIGENPSKKYSFTLEERIDLLTESLKEIPNVKVMHFSGKYLVKFAQSLGVSYIVRGIRNEKDYNDEKDMRYINSDLNPKIETIFVIPPKHLVEVSSSMVKGLVGPQGWEKVIRPYLTESVYHKIITQAISSQFETIWSELSSESDLAKQMAKKTLSTIIKKYLESTRHYHNISHILDCINELNTLKVEKSDYKRLFLAILFHDVIYDTKAKDNEQKSKELFVKLAQESKLKDVDISVISELIMATKTHLGTNDLENLMLDIDLSILGRDQETFDLYDSDIRKEYCWVPEVDYQKGRKKIMSDFCLRDRIFKSQVFFDKYEVSAKRNLRKFL
jgi:pantetheine-phosphate adenylyltransferase